MFTGTANLAFIAFSTALNSEAFAVLSSIFLAALFVDYFVLLAFTVRDIAKGKLLDGRDDEQKKD